LAASDGFFSPIRVAAAHSMLANQMMVQVPASKPSQLTSVRWGRGRHPARCCSSDAACGTSG
jgi:hypothetical protein